MFSFLRRAFRPFASIGQKIGSMFNIGRKAAAPVSVGIVKEPVIGRFIDVPKFVRGPRGDSFLTNSDYMLKSGSWRGYG